MNKEFETILMKNDDKFLKLFGKHFRSRVDRTLLFVDAVSPSKLFQSTMLPPAVGMTLAGTFGGLLGLGVGGPKGAAIGAGSGVGVGFLAGGSYAGYKTRKEYKKWLAQFRNDELFPDFVDFFESQRHLSEFICPLSKRPMHYPFVDPWGHSYEHREIREWVKRHGHSPVAKAPLKLSQLRPNYALMGKQAKVYSELLEKESDSVSLTALQREGISALLKDLHRQMHHCFESENQVLYQKLKNEEISMRTYAAQLNLIADMLNQ